ncbi:HEAT repeat domain-containing protein [Hellea balneolensis]|uniref:HEAT repeat domain-containing protein n=1 Tax=Hellea balneolensis TaxID=287478 RepID=UPI00041AA11D|nr:HEAT repeat domain-containing protein [Hellea balneolensis]
MRFTGIISAVVLSTALGSLAQAKPALTSAEIRVCKTLSQCVDIVERHAPDSFDYRVLNSEFQRFGRKGKAALIDMLASDDETDMRRAQAVLAKGQTLLTPDEQRKVAALWPRGDLDTHAKIMKSALSPLMRARMIETLSDDNPKVREVSRDIIAATVARKMDFPLRPDDYGKLARAILDDPTPALVELMANFEPAKTAPVFTRLLRSEDGPTLFAAYQKLFEQDPETAFKALVATLYGLKDDQTKAAFALSHVLRERHKRREDGFYLKFAKDLAEDSEMSLMGRLAGFDAIMQSAEAPLLSEPSQYYNVMQLALRSYPILPKGYLRNMPQQAGETPDLWLSAYWNYFRRKTGDQKLGFVRLLGKFENNAATNILIEALSDPGDWRILQAAALPLGRNKTERAKPALNALKDHPIMAVQVATLTALDGIETGSLKGRMKYWKASLSAASAYCSAAAKDFKDDAKALPFFDLVDLGFKASGDKRRFISTISPTKNGYLVGFDAGRNGGDLRYYDNASGDSLPLKPLMSGPLENITAIIPVTPPPLGQYAKAFWVIAQDNGQTDQAKLFRLSGPEGAFKLAYQAELPHRVTVLAPQKNGDVFMSFYKPKTKRQDVNPPLLLSPTGAIRRACSSPADTTEALP